MVRISQGYFSKKCGGPILGTPRVASRKPHTAELCGGILNAERGTRNGGHRRGIRRLFFWTPRGSGRGGNSTPTAPGWPTRPPHPPPAAPPGPGGRAAGSNAREADRTASALRQFRQLAALEIRISVDTLAIHENKEKPLAFVFPSRGGDEWPLWRLRIVKIYDLLCGLKRGRQSSSVGPEELLRTLPSLNPERLRGAVRYYDALTHDTRLVIDTLRSVAGHGAVCRNYVRMHDAKTAPSADAAGASPSSPWRRCPPPSTRSG